LWWRTPIIPGTLQRPKAHEFKRLLGLGYIVKPCLKRETEGETEERKKGYFCPL
jgi:hypothetical protein